MPFKDKEKQREAMRLIMRKRLAALGEQVEEAKGVIARLEKC